MLSVNLSYDRVHNFIVRVCLEKSWETGLSSRMPGKVMGNRLCLKKSWNLDYLDFSWKNRGFLAHLSHRLTVSHYVLQRTSPKLLAEF